MTKLFVQKLGGEIAIAYLYYIPCYIAHTHTHTHTDTHYIISQCFIPYAIYPGHTNFFAIAYLYCCVTFENVIYYLPRCKMQRNFQSVL